MNAPAGWYPDPTNAHVTRYWNGDRYTHERHWNGSAWVAPPPIPPPAAPRPATFAPVEAAPASAQPAPAPVTPEPASFAAVETTPTPTADAPLAPTPTSNPAQNEAGAPPPAAAYPQPAPAYPMPAPAAPAGSTTTAERPKPPLGFWLLVAGCAGVALAAFLPWYSVSGFGVSTSSGPRDGGPLLLVILAAAIAAIAWPTLTNAPLSMARKIGLIPIVGFLAIAVVTNWSDLGDLKDQTSGKVFGVTVNSGISVSPGAGLLLYTVSVILLVVLVVRFWVSARTSSAPA
jgi:hypothetical protein